MFELHTAQFVLIGITLVAAIVNGGIGYGFSSITVPVALLFFSNKALNPALVLAEVGINFIVLYANRRAFRRVLPEVAPMLVGAVPGVIAGALLLATASNRSLKLATYLVLLPLIVAQTAGFRYPLKRTRLIGAPLGAAVGVLYAATTVSGPPLAVLFNNQGLAKEDFRAALGIFRVVESSVTAVSYLALGLFTHASLVTAATLTPSVLVGLPIGFLLLRNFAPETFRRTCMGTDALLVGFGLTRTLIDAKLLSTPVAYAGFASVVLLELVILVRFVRFQRLQNLAAQLLPEAAASTPTLEVQP